MPQRSLSPSLPLFSTPQRVASLQAGGVGGRGFNFGKKKLILSPRREKRDGMENRKKNRSDSPKVDRTFFAP